MKTSLKIGGWIITILLIVSFSIRIEPLDSRQTGTFDPMKEVNHFWHTELPKLLRSDRIVDADLFRNELRLNRKLLIDRYGRTLGIGAPYSMLVGGRFEVVEVGEELVGLRTAAGARFDLRRDLLFGNTVREVSGSFSIDDYENTMDFNHIAAALNRCVLERVIAPNTALLGVGARVEVIGAVDLAPSGEPKACYELIPLHLTAASNE